MPDAVVAGARRPATRRACRGRSRRRSPGRGAASASLSIACAILPASSGWPPSTPVSMTATRRAVAARRGPTRRAGPCARPTTAAAVSGGVPRRGLGRRERRVVGDEAQLVAALDLDVRDAGARAQARARRARERAAAARLDGRRAPICGTCAPSRAHAVERPTPRGSRACAARGRGSSVTSSAPGALGRGRRRRASASSGASASEPAIAGRCDRRATPLRPSGGAGSEAERELRVLAHLLRRPRRVEGHRALDGRRRRRARRRTPRSAR